MLHVNNTVHPLSCSLTHLFLLLCDYISHDVSFRLFQWLGFFNWPHRNQVIPSSYPSWLCLGSRPTGCASVPESWVFLKFLIHLFLIHKVGPCCGPNSGLELMRPVACWQRKSLLHDGSSIAVQKRHGVKKSSQRKFINKNAACKQQSPKYKRFSS